MFNQGVWLSKGVDVTTVLFDRPLEKAAALSQGTAFLALGQVQILPIGDGLLGKWPKGWPQDTELMVVYRYGHAPYREKGNCAIELVLIIEGVNPEFVNIPRCVSNIFEPHKGDMFNESQIAVSVFHEIA